ncbi:hypothetical protein [Methylocaldum marinum]|nr:hypothetical protein [Methylocaldum marinum]
MKIVTIILLVLGALLALGVFLAVLPWIEVAVLNRFFAKEIATNADLPWAAPGRKARYLFAEILGLEQRAHRRPRLGLERRA